MKPDQLAGTDYSRGHAVAFMMKHGGDAQLSHCLTGQLYLSKSGWLLLSVPNSLGRGAFDAINEPGTELPVHDSDGGRYNAHISVMSPADIAEIGGPDRISERGHEFTYTLGPVRTAEPRGMSEMSRVWFIEVSSPALERLRKSYGLSDTPNDGKHQFHITFAVRKRNVTRDAQVAVGRSLIHNPAAGWKAAAEELAQKQPVQTASGDAGWDIRPSRIQGRGIHATRDYAAGEVIVPRLMYRMDDGARYEQSDAARYTNHANDPNAEIQPTGGYVELRARRPIPAGTEITADYGATTQRLGGANAFRYTYQDRDYDGGSDDDIARREKLRRIGGDSATMAAAALVTDPHIVDLLGRDDPGDDFLDPTKVGASMVARFTAGLPGWDQDQLPADNLAKLAAAESGPLQRLLAAKAESDRRNYSAKHQILRELLAERAAEFLQDEDRGGIVGLTHVPTKFKIHAPKKILPANGVTKQAGDPPPQLTLEQTLLPVAALTGLGGLYGATVAPGDSALRGALIGALGGAGAGTGYVGSQHFVESPYGRNLGSSLPPILQAGSTAGGLHGGLLAGRWLAKRLGLGDPRDRYTDDLASIDVLDPANRLLPGPIREYIRDEEDDHKKKQPQKKAMNIPVMPASVPVGPTKPVVGGRGGRGWGGLAVNLAGQLWNSGAFRTGLGAAALGGAGHAADTALELKDQPFTTLGITAGGVSGLSRQRLRNLASMDAGDKWSLKSVGKLLTAPNYDVAMGLAKPKDAYRWTTPGGYVSPGRLLRTGSTAATVAGPLIAAGGIVQRPAEAMNSAMIDTAGFERNVPSVTGIEAIDKMIDRYQRGARLTGAMLSDQSAIGHALSDYGWDRLTPHNVLGSVRDLREKHPYWAKPIDYLRGLTPGGAAINFGLQTMLPSQGSDDHTNSVNKALAQNKIRFLLDAIRGDLVDSPTAQELMRQYVHSYKPQAFRDGDFTVTSPSGESHSVSFPGTPEDNLRGSVESFMHKGQLRPELADKFTTERLRTIDRAIRGYVRELDAGNTGGRAGKQLTSQLRDVGLDVGQEVFKEFIANTGAKGDELKKTVTQYVQQQVKDPATRKLVSDTLAPLITGVAKDENVQKALQEVTTSPEMVTAVRQLVEQQAGNPETKKFVNDALASLVTDTAKNEKVRKALLDMARDPENVAALAEVANDPLVAEAMQEVVRKQLQNPQTSAAINDAASNAAKAYFNSLSPEFMRGVGGTAGGLAGLVGGYGLSQLLAGDDETLTPEQRSQRRQMRSWLPLLALGAGIPAGMYLLPQEMRSFVNGPTAAVS